MRKYFLVILIASCFSGFGQSQPTEKDTLYTLADQDTLPVPVNIYMADGSLISTNSNGMYILTRIRLDSLRETKILSIRLVDTIGANSFLTGVYCTTVKQNPTITVHKEFMCYDCIQIRDLTFNKLFTLNKRTAKLYLARRRTGACYD